MKKQTAVEWLIEQIDTKVCCLVSYDGMVDIIAQAKAMEKEQIIQAACYEPWIGDLPKSEGEHYYKENYESNS